MQTTLVIALGLAAFYKDPVAAGLQLVVLVLVWVNHARARWSSTALLLFWPVHVAALAVSARTDFDIHDSRMGQYHASLAVLELIALLWELPGPEAGMQEDPRENPLARANIFSVWSFGWLTPFMKVRETRRIGTVLTGM